MHKKNNKKFIYIPSFIKITNVLALSLGIINLTIIQQEK